MKYDGKWKGALCLIVLLFNGWNYMIYINFNEKHQQMVKNELHYDR